MKKNSAERYESIDIKLEKYKFPIAYAAKKKELIEQYGMTEQQAEDYIETTPIEMEIYYQEGYGMFLVEAEAVECSAIYSPYTKEELEDADKD